MPATTLERDAMAKSFAVARTLLMDLEARLKGIDAIYNSASGVKATLTQEEMNEIPELSGLTKTQLDDGIYAMTALILPGITSGYAALAQLAARNL